MPPSHRPSVGACCPLVLAAFGQKVLPEALHPQTQQLWGLLGTAPPPHGTQGCPPSPLPKPLFGFAHFLGGWGRWMRRGPLGWGPLGGMLQSGGKGGGVCFYVYNRGEGE